MNAAHRSIETILRKLDFDDLLYWAGEKIVNRGRSYVKHVDQLARTEDNALVAWVTGTERYATSVRIDNDGSFDDAKVGVSPSTLNRMLQGNHEFWQARQTVDLDAVERIDFHAAWSSPLAEYEAPKSGAFESVFVQRREGGIDSRPPWRSPLRGSASRCQKCLLHFLSNRRLLTGPPLRQ